jgi:HEAT repeat protein
MFGGPAMPLVPRNNPDFDRCSDPSSDLVAAYRATIELDDDTSSLAVVHYRGGQTEFDLGRRYAVSPDPLDRVTGADVLAQLGWSECTFLRESVEILISLLSDADDRVIAAAATGLGHRNDPAAIRPALKLVEHSNPDVRFGAVLALSKHDDDAAISGLIKLSGGHDDHVRDWAAFGLGSQTDLDKPDLREALARLLDDSDPEIRGEAMIGLARRRDNRAYPVVARELAGEFHGSWCLEAAELLANPGLLPLLQSLRATIAEEDRQRFTLDFDRAERACRD